MFISDDDAHTFRAINEAQSGCIGVHVYGLLQIQANTRSLTCSFLLLTIPDLSVNLKSIILHIYFTLIAAHRILVHN